MVSEEQEVPVIAQRTEIPTVQLQIDLSMSNGVQRFYNFSLGRKNGYSIKDVYNTALQI